jgi:catalase
MVPGIGASPDKMLQGRLFSYPDTHRHRIGPNYLQLPVNQPKAAAVHSYNKDGAMRYQNPGDPVYAPNSYGGPVADPALFADDSYEVTGEIMRTAYTKRRDDDDFVQPRALVEQAMTATDREHLITNIVAHVKVGVLPETLPRVIEYWTNVSPDLGSRIAKAL